MDDVEQFYDFGSLASSGSVKGLGWSFQEEGFTWTIGDAAILVLPARQAETPARLMLAARPMLHSGLLRQRVRLKVDGRLFAELDLSEEGVLEAEIPALAASAGEGAASITVTLELPDAVSPTVAGHGADDRPLGLAVKWVRWGDAHGGVRSTGGEGRRKTILLVRHHQSGGLAAIFNRLSVLQGCFAVVACDPVLTRVRDAVVGLLDGDLAAIWLQQGHGSPTAEEVRALSFDVPIVTFPFLHMDVLWPFGGDDSRLLPEPPLYPHGRYPYSDAVASSLSEAAGSLSDSALLDAYMRLTDERMPDLPVAFAAYAHALSADERDCDIKLSGFILGTFQSKPLFQNRVMPDGTLLAQLAVQLATQGGLFGPELLGPVLLELDRLMVGYTGHGLEQVPIHPKVAAAYHLRWHRAERLYRWHDNRWTFSDYMINYIRWSPWTV